MKNNSVSYKFLGDQYILHKTMKITSIDEKILIGGKLFVLFYY